MPITKFRLVNFKCFADSGEVPLAPLTVIFGRNNSGKSSILQSLLLLRQTLDSPEYGPRLNLRGPLYPAGTYIDLVHQHRAKHNLSITLGVTSKSASGEIEMEYSNDEPQPPRLARLRIQGRGVEPLEIRRGRGAGGPYELYIGGKNVGGEKNADFRFPVDRFLPLIGDEPPRVGRPSQARARSRDLARRLLNEVQNNLRGLRAVGPFRQPPFRRYEYQGRGQDIVDAMGANVVSALIEDTTKRGRRRGELLRGVNRWLNIVGRVRLMPIKRISRTARIFEVRLRDTDSGRWANFADVGFGIGQALPVLVEGLRTPEEGAFLVQEPEIHLHPDAQLGMADFLISLVRSGTRVIAETHSENLLLRLRKVVASGGRQHRGGSPLLSPNDIGVIYVDKTVDGTSHVHALQMDRLGQIKDWPRGFMEEATQERIDLMEEVARQVEGT